MIRVVSCLGFCNWQGSSADYHYGMVRGIAAGVVGVNEQWLVYV